MSRTTVERRELPSAEPLLVWRAELLRRLGLTPERALELAEQGFEPHELERLLRLGCPLGPAIRIVRPL